MPKSFYTQGKNNNQVLKQVSENNLLIYDKLSDLKADIDNLEEGMIVATIEDEFKEDAFDEINERLDALEKEVDDLMNSTGTGDGIAFTGTRAELEEALKIQEGEEGYIPENALVLITDEEEELSE